MAKKKPAADSGETTETTETTEKKKKEEASANVAINLDSLGGGVDENLLANLISGVTKQANLVDGYERNATRDLAELFRAQELRDEGAWVKFPPIKGAWIRVRSIEHSTRRLRELQDEYREEHGLPRAELIPYEVREELFRKSFFGTAITGLKWIDDEVEPPVEHEDVWPLGGGKFLPFTEKAIEQLMHVKEFEDFVSNTSASKTLFRQIAASELAGN